MERIRCALYKSLLWVMDRYFTDLHEQTNTARVMAVSSQVAVELQQQWLKRQGMLHCEFCAQRFGLRNVNGRLACVNHLEQAAA